MAIKGIDINATRTHISKYDPDKKNPTKWKIGILDSIIKAMLKDSITTYEIASGGKGADRAKTTLNVYQNMVGTVRFGLKGFENFPDPITDEPIKFETQKAHLFSKAYDVVTDDILKKIDEKVLYELAEEIFKEIQLSGEEEKN